MKIQSLRSIDQLPKVVRLLLEHELTHQEKANFVFGESFNGRVYCLIDVKADSIIKNRVHTIKTCYLTGRDLTIYHATRELITIFRDQIEFDANVERQNDTDLDKRFFQILKDAIQAGASDVHFEIHQNKADIRFRIHGMLYTISQMDTRTIYRMVNYVYNVAAEEGSKDTQFNIDEMQNALLDRHIEINGIKQHYKIRLQTAPCYPSSLTIVMRILPIDNQLSLGLKDLGYSEDQIKLLQKAQMKPSGVTIISGTTGSGKSTTLATLLAEIHQRTQGTKKILTTEDPPEYSINGANQINLSTKPDFQKTDENIFVKAIKVAMRCDPDVIMVGEVRDQKSGDLLSSAVVSGHQVFTTVHAASALSIFDRLMQLGFDRHVLTSPGFISLLVYQTLSPVLCKQCRVSLHNRRKQTNTTDFKELLQRIDEVLQSERYRSVISLEEAEHSIFFANVEGCDECRRGFTGRTVFAEMVSPDSILLQHYRDNEYEKGIRHWRSRGGRTALEHGIEKMLLGLVDPQSVEDKCGLITDVCEGD